jgi:hypothetical protein
MEGDAGLGGWRVSMVILVWWSASDHDSIVSDEQQSDQEPQVDQADAYIQRRLERLDTKRFPPAAQRQVEREWAYELEHHSVDADESKDDEADSEEEPDRVGKAPSRAPVEDS